MQVVYWLEMVSPQQQVTDIYGETSTVPAQYEPRSQVFSSNQLLAALACAEDKRAQRRAGQPILGITIASEDPNCVGEMGVSDKLPEGYDWTKQDRAGKTRRR